jgi:UDP-4-amino-4,6-dideoxy-N-acetyl-beta-L-altrosamine transaminase
MKNKFIPFCRPSIGKEEINEMTKALKSGWLTTGPRTVAFEKALARYVGARRTVAVNSCTGALHLALLALDIGPDDEVITSPFTFASTANVIVQVGAKPVFVDIDQETFNIDPEKIEKAITSKTKAIIPVHYAGQACDMDRIMKIAKKYRLYVIEDAAHAIGTEYKNKKIGSIGTATCFSFYATKNMTTGEGGAVTTNNAKLAEKIEVLKLHGMNRDAWKRYTKKGSWYYRIETCGWKYNMTDVQAALGLSQLKKLDAFNRIRRKYAKIYSQELKKIPGIVTPAEKDWGKHIYYLYPILLKNYDRDKFIQKMAKRGVQCSVHFIPLHMQPFYRKTFGFKPSDFPNSKWIYEKEISLPLYPKMTERDIKFVVGAINQIING